METTIATLLKDFEDGKMTRRQLIQSLAVLATAAAPAAQTPGARGAARLGKPCGSITSRTR